MKSTEVVVVLVIVCLIVVILVGVVFLLIHKKKKKRKKKTLQSEGKLERFISGKNKNILETFTKVAESLHTRI